MGQELLVYDPDYENFLVPGLRPVYFLHSPHVIIAVDVAWYRDEFLATPGLENSSLWLGGGIKFQFGDSVGNAIYEVRGWRSTIALPVWGWHASAPDPNGNMTHFFGRAAQYFKQPYGYDPAQPGTVLSPTPYYRLGYENSGLTFHQVWSGDEDSHMIELSSGDIMSGIWKSYATSTACVSVGVYT